MYYKSELLIIKIGSPICTSCQTVKLWSPKVSCYLQKGPTMLMLRHSDHKYLSLMHKQYPPLLEPQIVMPRRTTPTIKGHILQMYLSEAKVCMPTVISNPVAKENLSCHIECVPTSSLEASQKWNEPIKWVLGTHNQTRCPPSLKPTDSHYAILITTRIQICQVSHPTDGNKALGINSMYVNLHNSYQNVLRNVLPQSLSMYSGNPWSLESWHLLERQLCRSQCLIL